MTREQAIEKYGEHVVVQTEIMYQAENYDFWSDTGSSEQLQDSLLRCTAVALKDCSVCEHKFLEHHGGHCYMFREKMPRCAQWKLTRVHA